MAQRLHVVIARTGVASRRQAERLILEGRVTVNDTVVATPGALVDSERDAIRVDKRLLRPPESKITIVLNKPKGVVTTSSDPQGRPTTAGLVKAIKARLFAVGRLDFNSEGLLVLTNDGELAHLLQHPRFGITKVYETKVRGLPSDRTLARLRSGIMLDDRRTAPAKVKVLRTTGKNAWLEIAIREGRNRQVRRMCLAVGHPVVKLKRTRYGPLELKDLAPGCYRRLGGPELARLRASALGGPAREASGQKP